MFIAVVETLPLRKIMLHAWSHACRNVASITLARSRRSTVSLESTGNSIATLDQDSRSCTSRPDGKIMDLVADRATPWVHSLKRNSRSSRCTIKVQWPDKRLSRRSSTSRKSWTSSSMANTLITVWRYTCLAAPPTSVTKRNAIWDQKLTTTSSIS